MAINLWMGIASLYIPGAQRTGARHFWEFISEASESATKFRESAARERHEAQVNDPIVERAPRQLSSTEKLFTHSFGFGETHDRPTVKWDGEGLSSYDRHLDGGAESALRHRGAQDRRRKANELESCAKTLEEMVDLCKRLSIA
jgi:hypothetical protein